MSTSEYRKTFNNWKKSSSGKYAKEIMLRRQLFMCPSCMKDLDKCSTKHIHHLFPISRMDESNKGLAINLNNLVVLCESCNLRQGNAIDERFD